MSSKTDRTVIIVESPTKAKTISKLLSGPYRVISSYGHIRDLPKSRLGVDPEKDFEPHYLIPKGAKPHVKALIAETEGAHEIILATDEDREGEAIAWHITKVLDEAREKAKAKGKIKEEEEEAEVKRIVFHEITKKAIEEALAHPRGIDMHLVNSQQARRILDRLVGYELSPFLWKKLVGGLSAGRVQSAALRRVVEREAEIKKFVPQEYWTIAASLIKKNGAGGFIAALFSIGNKKLEKFDVKSKAEADAIVNALEGAAWRVARIAKKETRKIPPPPFTTSTLQQEASKKLRFSARQTMMFAQQLYEGVDLPEGSVGLITYMRTDSVHLSEDSIQEARAEITQRFGTQFVPAAPRRYKTKSKLAQEAHEAVRPTDPHRHPNNLKTYLTLEQWKLYNLVWRRFIACQMEAAVFDTTAVDAEAMPQSDKTPHIFRANGIVKKFAGFLEAYPLKFEDAVLPELTENEGLTAKEVKGEEHFTQPPPRFTEASLIKALEEYGIGRPSTYAPTLATIQSRGYVEKDEKRRLVPTEIGTKVSTLLVAHFPEIVDIAFTATMEEELDKVAEGTMEWRKILKDFYGPFHKNLELKYEEVKKENMVEQSDEVCDKCGNPMVIRTGRFGKFLACSKFPECKNTKSIKKTTGITCRECNEGELIEKKTKKRRIFWGCSRYPDCKYATWANPIKQKEEAEAAQAKEESAGEDADALDS